MDGIVLLHKEAGMTSHDVVNRLRKILGIRKIGHSGTLDPNATGVLLVMVGKACKVLPYLEDTDKEYVATIKLGMKTISDDIWGEVLDTKEIKKINDFQKVLDTFKGEIKQLPPMVSSVRVNGKKLYEYARKHEIVERPLRDVSIYDIESLDDEKLKFRVHCSSGTYVRSLCHDIGDQTDNYACMSSLVRTKVGRFSLEECATLDDIAAGNYTIHSIEEVLSHYPFIVYAHIDDIYHGKKVQLSCNEDTVVMVDQGKAIAIYQKDHDQIYRCMRGLW